MCHPQPLEFAGGVNHTAEVHSTSFPSGNGTEGRPTHAADTFAAAAYPAPPAAPSFMDRRRDQTRPASFDQWLTSSDFVALAGISYRQLDYWTRTGRIAQETPAEGSGSVRGYTHSEMLVARTIGALVRIGLHLQTAHDVARALETDRVVPLDDHHYLVRISRYDY